MTRRALPCGLILATMLAAMLAACGGEAPASPTEAVTSEPALAPDPGAPRGPSGQAEPSCAGASRDPAELELLASRAEADLAGTLSALTALVGRNPGSATARVILGELTLRAEPAQASVAVRWFDRALALHDEGCTLGHRHHWAALEGAALARMMQGEYAPALPLLQRSLERWPTVPSTRYNLACALCMTGDLDGCERELSRVMAAREPGPDFLAQHTRPLEHYEAMARQDPDLAPLRAEPERLARVLTRE